jgi:alpha-D-xyloside xylohydrolase
LLVRAGSIIPIGPVEQYTGEKRPTDLEIRVYPGTDGNFTLYEDEGTNYNYEKGMRSTIHFHWNDAKRELSIAQGSGRFPGMLQSRQFKIVAVDSSSPRQVRYDGKRVGAVVSK